MVSETVSFGYICFLYVGFEIIAHFYSHVLHFQSMSKVGLRQLSFRSSTNNGCTHLGLGVSGTGSRLGWMTCLTPNPIYPSKKWFTSKTDRNNILLMRL